MKKLFLACVLAATIHGVGIAGDCVPQKTAIDEWNHYLNGSESNSFMGIRITTLECDPCKCGDSEAACLRFRAAKAEIAEQALEESRKLLERAKQFGICPK